MILCIDIDAFFVSVEQALNPHLKGKPVIVGGVPSQRGVVASASYEARRYGIKAGMPLSHAYRLCPQAIFLHGNFRNYKAYSEKFYEILTHYSPIVEMASLDEAFLDIKGTKRLFGEPEELGQKLKNEIREKLSIPTTIGIARTRTIAKIAVDAAKPDGLFVIYKDNELPFLKPLPVDVLPGIGPKNFEILNHLNIKTVEDFLKTPSWILNLALGVHSQSIRFLIQGGDYKFIPKTKSVSRETTFEEDTLDLDFIEATIYYLLERACCTLRAENLLAQKLTAKVRFSDQLSAEPLSGHPATLSLITERTKENPTDRRPSIRSDIGNQPVLAFRQENRKAQPPKSCSGPCPTSLRLQLSPGGQDNGLT